ncbi:hypothetical protein D9M71_840980 [compost metagenome]
MVEGLLALRQNISYLSKCHLHGFLVVGKSNLLADLGQFQVGAIAPAIQQR